jgi:two-component system, cell cycle response regulator
MAAAMGSLLLLYACWQLFGWTPGHRALVGDIFFYPFVAAAAWAAWRASKRCSAAPRLRSAWRLLTLAFLASFGGEIAQTVYEALHRKPFPSAADAFFLSFYPLMLWGLLRFAVGRRNFSERVRLGLDLAVVAIGSSAVVLYVVLGPTVVAGSPNLLQGVFSVAYPVGDVVLLVGLASVLVREADRSARQALRFVALGLLLYVVGDVMYGYISLNSTYRGGDLVDSLWVVAIAMWAVAGSAQSAPGALSQEMVEVRRARASWAPHLASAVGFAVLIVVLRRHPFFPDVSLAVTAVAIAALVSARQFFAQRDLISIQLRSSYQSLHDVLTGLPNRRSLIDDLVAALVTSENDRPRTFAMFDLDGFKAYNDTFGHLAGDRLLARLGNQLREFVAVHGRAYRLGGDEFCILFDSTGVPSGQIVADAAWALSEAGSGFSVRASYGMVTMPDEANDVSAVLHIADTRMYAKKSGRRVEAIVSQTRDVLLRASAEHSEDLQEHMLKVGELSSRVARRLGLDAEAVELTLQTGELHDVGKIAIPGGILSKPGPLDDNEWGFIHNHTVIGERILNAAIALKPVAKLVRSTHERYDGAGYPDGLAGEQIPLPSRIVFVCDGFLAMTTDRPYGHKMSEAEARAELRRCAGSQFDPRVVDALLAHLDDSTPSQPQPEPEPSGTSAPDTRHLVAQA